MINTLLSIADELTIGSNYIFQMSCTLEGVLWDLTGATVSLVIADKNAIQTRISATGYFGGAQTIPWSAVGMPGSWTRAWDITDATGIRQISLPIPFILLNSPI